MCPHNTTITNSIASDNDYLSFSNGSHSFDADMAAEYGIAEAILINHFKFWINKNARIKSKKSFKEGKYWTFQTLEDIAAHYPYFTTDQVRDLIERLCTGKNRKSKKSQTLDFEPVIIKGNFNINPYDRTIWYTFSGSFREKWGNPQIQKGKSPIPKREIPTPIPDTKTYTKKEDKEREEVAAPQPCALSFFTHGNVKIKQEAYDKLLSDYGKEKIDKFVGELQDYSETNIQFKKYINHGAVIRKWIKRSEAQEKLLKQKALTPKLSREEADRAFAKKIQNAYPKLFAQDRIQINTEHIGFSRHLGDPNTVYIRFGANGFKEQAINQLRKWNLDIKKIEEE